MTSEPSQAGIFTQLDPLLVHRAVLITISKTEGDRLQVNICPRQLKEGENPALTVPLCVTGTAAELDADLVPQISRFVASHIGLNSNLTAIEKEIAEAEKAETLPSLLLCSGRRPLRPRRPRSCGTSCSSSSYPASAVRSERVWAWPYSSEKSSSGS